MVVVEVDGYEIEPGANLTAADLSAANLEGVDLTSVEVNQYAHWPEGFEGPPLR